VELVVERCAGVDVGKDEVVACVRAPGPNGNGPAQAKSDLRVVHVGLEAMARLVHR
jgi:hypothetical protein